MKIKSRYFIGTLTNGHTAKVCEVIAGGQFQQRKPSKNNRVIVKLKEGDINTHHCLSSWPEFDHAGIIEELKKDEWN